MLRVYCLSGLFWALCASSAASAAPHTYWPGFKGQVSQFLVPLDTTTGQNRYLTLKIRLAADPRAKPRAFDNAFHAVCQRHHGKLVKTAKKMSSHLDWRVKITFEWPVKATNGVAIGHFKSSVLQVSNCRKA